MEKFDKNYVIGFILFFAMYGTYMYFMPEPIAPPVQEPTAQVEQVEATQNTIASVESLDSTTLAQKFGSFASLMQGEGQDVILENKHLKITLGSQGGQVKDVILKEYKTYDTYVNNGDEPLKLIDEEIVINKLEIPTATGTIDLRKLYFTVDQASSSSAVFNLTLPDGSQVKQLYNLEEDAYILDYKVEGNGAAFNTGQNWTFSWENKLKKLEKDLNENRKAAQINYYTNEEDFEDIGFANVSGDYERVEEPVKWFSFKQKYFTSGLISNGGYFTGVEATLDVPENDSSIVKDAIITASFPVSKLSDGFKYYFGPNDFKELKKAGDDFHQNLYLGYDIVKPINRFLFVPLFDWFESFISNYGLLIILVVLVIKITLTPLIYKSYSSSAKMRVLAPEIAEIKERVGDDSVKVQQETMKLYQQVGVSPLSGCVPMVLQMPILMSVFFLFPNMEMFRQKAFLWANDLSTYDAPISWGFDIPVIGNHLSLFVVLMTLSSLAFTYYNNQITPAQQGPVDMRKISYIFPLVFFFVLNSFPAALSFYYLCSNLVTIGQQLIVKRFIDEDKIRTVLEENKKNYSSKPKKKNKFSNYLQKQLETQEAANKEKAKQLKNRKKK